MNVSMPTKKPSYRCVISSLLRDETAERLLHELLARAGCTSKIDGRKTKNPPLIQMSDSRDVLDVRDEPSPSAVTRWKVMPGRVDRKIAVLFAGLQRVDEQRQRAVRKGRRCSWRGTYSSFSTYFWTAFSRMPMLAWSPVSTNVIFQSSMSLDSRAMSLAALGQREVVREVLVVVEEVVLDDVGLVAEAEDEFLVPEVGVVLHHVPENRPVADVDHRLGDDLGVLLETHPQAAAEEYDLHELVSW